MLEHWNPWFGWAMDLLKFAVTFGASAVVTVLIINRIQEQRARERSRAEALFKFQMDALAEFRRAALIYEVSALSAYTDVYQWKGGDKTAAMQNYGVSAYGNYQVALDGLKHRFKDNSDALRFIEELKETHEKRHKIYDELVDIQLDTGPGINMWSHASKERVRFNKLLKDAGRLRQEINSAVENEILATT